MKCQFKGALKPWVRKKQQLPKICFARTNNNKKCRLKNCKWVLTAKKDFWREKKNQFCNQFVNGSFHVSSREEIRRLLHLHTHHKIDLKLNETRKRRAREWERASRVSKINFGWTMIGNELTFKRNETHATTTCRLHMFSVINLMFICFWHAYNDSVSRA